MSTEKMKTFLFTIGFVTLLASVYKVKFPDTSKGTAFLLILSLLIIFHTIGRWIFSRRGEGQ